LREQDRDTGEAGMIGIGVGGEIDSGTAFGGEIIE